MGRNDVCFCGSGKKQKKCHVDIKADSAFGNMLTLHTLIDKMIEENTKFDKLKCKKGCSECCYQNFAVSTVEFYYIIYDTLKNKGVEKTKDYITSGYNMWIEYEKEFPESARLLKMNVENTDVNKTNSLMHFIDNSLDASPMFNKFPCPFLNVSEGSCEVYEVRPFICRHYGVGYLDKHTLPTAFCSHTMNETMDEDFMTDLSGILDEIVKLDTYYSPKYNKLAYDRPYPIFYYCKIAYEHWDILDFKIRERKDMSKGEFANIRIDRAIRK